MNEQLNSYASALIEESMMVRDEISLPEMAFTEVVLDKIEPLLDCEEIIKEHCVLTKVNGDIVGELHAYAQSTNGEVLYLFYTYFNHKEEIVIKGNTECAVCLTRPQGFYNKAIRGVHLDVDSESPEYRAGKFIYDNHNNFKSVNIVILSNYVINNLSISNRIKIASKPVYQDVWDLKKIYGNTHSMSDHMAIDIDFESDDYKRYKIPFIQMESTQFGYKCIQAMFPAKLLYSLYERYNTNLLYNNVRYFLGLKGNKEQKPNVAMLNTLRKENEMFLAYNNGITALAKGIESDLVNEKTDVSDPENTTSSQYISMGMLKKIFDFRIINGGQTTAVIFNAKNLSDGTVDKDKKVSLLGVYVQIKLIISDEIEKISGNIALSSNFQNKVKYSDFSVSNEFNRKMEQYSRSIKAPNPNNEPTFWFYERLRGQYDESKKRIHTKADKDYFDFQFPKHRKFTKEDVAKVWCNWNQCPFHAVKGATTTYSTFMRDIMSRGFVPDEQYYKDTIALLIIFNFLKSREENKKYANAKATVIAYTMAMLQCLTIDQFDLQKVWLNQKVSDATKIFLNSLSDKIFAILNNQALQSGSTILSYGKTQGAYEIIKKNPFEFKLSDIENDLK